MLPETTPFESNVRAKNHACYVYLARNGTNFYFEIEYSGTKKLTALNSKTALFECTLF